MCLATIIKHIYTQHVIHGPLHTLIVNIKTTNSTQYEPMTTELILKWRIRLSYVRVSEHITFWQLTRHTFFFINQQFVLSQSYDLQWYAKWTKDVNFQWIINTKLALVGNHCSHDGSHCTIQHSLSAWISGRTSVSGQHSFAIQHSTCSWRVGKLTAIGQPTRPTQPFILSGSINV